MPSAARVRLAKFRAAVVSLIALTILGVLVVLLTGGSLLKPKTTIYMLISDATGVTRESPVRVEGIDVGKVADVGLSGLKDPARVVRITIELLEENLVYIPVDSYAQLDTETLIGDKYVDISVGRSLQRIPPGGELAFKEQVDMLKTLDMQQFEASLRKVDEMLSGIEQGTSRVGQLVKGDKMYSDLLRRVGEADLALRQAVSATSRVGQHLYTDQMLQRIRGPLVQLDLTLARLQSGQGGMGQFLRDPAQYEKLRSGLQSLRQTVADVQSREFFLSDRQYDGWNSSVASIMQTVEQFNAGPLFGTTATFDNLNGTARALRDTLKDFRENPRKYMRLKVF